MPSPGQSPCEGRPWPAQNATGNWVKVTQRIPVRIKLDDADAELALRTGMSATVSIDTGASRGFGSIRRRRRRRVQARLRGRTQCIRLGAVIDPAGVR